MTLKLSGADLEKIESVFTQQIDRGLHHGAQLVIHRYGEVLVDLSAGYGDAHQKIPITPDTKFLTFSLTKPYTSACIFKLVEENEILLDDAIGYYWPEFSHQGKEEITIRQVLLHQSGLPKNRLVYQILNSRNWEKIVADLAGLKPDFPPGTRIAYQLLNFGFILGEIVRRVAGKPIDQFLYEQYLLPLGFSRTTMKEVDFQDEQFAFLSSGTLDHLAVAWIFNSQRIRGSLIPAASLQTTSREMAIFYQMLLNDGEYAGNRYLKPETVRLATSLGCEGYDQSLGRKTRWGYGFFLGGDHVLHPEYTDGMGQGSSLETFGHYGQRNSVAWADRRTGLVVVFLCNRFLSSNENKLRLEQISNAAWDLAE